MTSSAFGRARRPEQKEQRRKAILGAARELAGVCGVRNVTLGAVAEAVGLAKSNLARYFATREEIYLELLAQEWRGWAQDLSVRLPATRGRAQAAAAVAETIAARPLFCDLLSQVSTTLEHNVSIPAARDFKYAMHDVLATTAAELARATRLSEPEARELLGLAAGLAGLLWPLVNPPAVLEQLYAQDPQLAAGRADMVPTLVRSLTALAAGLPTLRKP
jgi:AcrR family transcriptional regulator